MDVHCGGEAFEVEFLALDGNTAAIATVSAAMLRPVTATDLTHARVFDDAEQQCSGQGGRASMC